MKKILLLLSFFCFINSIYAHEYQAPAIAAHVQGDDLKQGQSLVRRRALVFSSWFFGYDTSSSKAFMDDWYHTQDLSALTFNKDSFKISDAFSPGISNGMSQNMNVNISAVKMFPRISSHERGINFGMQMQLPGPTRKSKIGARMSLPFKTIRIERDDQAEASAAGSQRGYLLNIVATAITPTGSSDANITALPTVQNDYVVANMYKASLLAGLPTIQGGVLSPMFNNDGSGNVMISGQTYQHAASDFGGIRMFANMPYVVFKWNNTRTLPNITNRAIQLPSISAYLNGGTGSGPIYLGPTDSQVLGNVIVDSGNTTAAANVHSPLGGSISTNLTVAPIQALPTDYKQIKDSVLYAFSPGQYAQYKTLIDTYGDTLWFMTTNANNGSVLRPTVDTAVQNQINRYGAQSSEDWLRSSGYEFKTTERTGLGDLDLDFFYEYAFSTRCLGQAIMGIKLPTESKVDPKNCPYTPALGSNGHYGIKLGGNGLWQLFSWLDLKADGAYTFMLPSKEKRFATFQDATIKNIGPVVDATVDYGLLTAGVHATVYHPKARVCNATIGYQFMYRSADHVEFKQKTFDCAANGGTWFGASSSGGANVLTLDNRVAEKNTRSVSHKIRLEAQMTAFNCVNIFTGGSYTLFGNHAPQERDLFLGIKTWF